MDIALVFVNLTGNSMAGLKGTMRFKLLDTNAVFAKLDIAIPPEAFGILQSGEGVLLHFDVPVKGLEKNQAYTGQQLQAALTQIEYMKPIAK